MTHRLGVVVNPVAGHGRGRIRGHEVLIDLAKAGYEVTDLSGDSASEALANARSQVDDHDAIVVVGGDGMAHLGINAVAGASTPLGLVAVGSGNDLARSLNLPIHDVPASLHMLAQGLDHGPRYIDAIATSKGVRPQPDPQWAGGIISAGFDAAVNGRSNDYRWPRGSARYIRGVVSELMGFRPYGYRLTIDGHTREFSGTLVALANGESFGGGMRIAPGARVDDGYIDVVIAADVRRRELLRIFPKVYQGRHVHHPAVEVLRATEVILETIPDHSRPVPAAFADGELLGPAPLHTRLEPRAIGVLSS